MAGQYPDKIKTPPLYDGRFDAYKLEAKDSDVLFASYPKGTSIPPHTYDTDNYGVITRGELILTINDVAQNTGLVIGIMSLQIQNMRQSLKSRQTKLNSALSMTTHHKIPDKGGHHEYSETWTFHWHRTI